MKQRLKNLISNIGEFYQEWSTPVYMAVIFLYFGISLVQLFFNKGVFSEPISDLRGIDVLMLIIMVREHRIVREVELQNIYRHPYSLINPFTTNPYEPNPYEPYKVTCGTDTQVGSETIKNF